MDDAPARLAASLARRASASSDGAPVPAIVVAVARALADRVDPGGHAVATAPLLDGRFGTGAALPADVATDLGNVAPDDAADVLGWLHQALLSPGLRQRRGVFYTPRHVAEGVVDAAWDGWALPADRGRHPIRVCDPACGGGAFLLAAGRRASAPGTARGELVENALWGIDVDPLAAAVADVALRLWAAAGGDHVARTNVVAGDALGVGLHGWHPGASPFDLVVGNPPFLNQLGRTTARTRDEAAQVRDRLGSLAQGYTDASALFLAAAVGMVGRGGRVGLVLPESFLVARDAQGARRAVLDVAGLTGLWLPRQALFAASVRVCAPVVERGAAPTEITRWLGADRRRVGAVPVTPGELRAAPTWGALVADLRGAPAVHLGGAGRLADLATATAGFRAQFYGVVPFVVDDPHGGRRPLADDDRPALVTSGLIDPAHLRWGGQPARFAGKQWSAPRVDMAALAAADPALGRWGRARLVPKVLLATQTRILEAVVDEHGTCWPSVPVISVEADPDRLWHVAAVLLSPAASAWAIGRYGGAALSSDAVKLAASQALELPLPPAGQAWDEAAGRVRAATAAGAAGDEAGWRRELVAAGVAMGAAYGVGEDVLAWWEGRLPAYRHPDLPG